MEQLPSEIDKSLQYIIYWIARMLDTINGTGILVPVKIIFLSILLLSALPLLIISSITYRTQPIKIASLLIAFSFGIKSISRIISRVFKNDEEVCTELQEIVDNFYLKNQECLVNRPIMVLYANKIAFWVKLNIMAYVICCICPIITSYVMNFINGTHELIIPIRIPFTDPETPTGYAINSIYIALLIIGLFFNLSFGEFFNLYLTLQAVLMVEIFNTKWKTFQRDLLENRKKEKELLEKYTFNFKSVTRMKRLLTHDQFIEYEIYKESTEELHGRFIALIRTYSEYNDYVSKVLNFMEFPSFIIFSLDSFCIGLCMLIMRFSSFFFGFPICTLLVLLIFLQCLEGTIVSHQNQKLLEEICGFPWYELSKPQQKLFLQFIHACQNTCTLVIPIVGELNMELFTNICNGAYSFLMYMIQFVKVAK